MQNSSCHFSSNKSVFLQILHHSLVSWKITSLYFFSSNNIYFAQKETIKMKILGLSSSAQVKICQIFYVNFETTSWFLSKFCISLQFNERLFLYTFLAQTMHTLPKRSPLKWKCLRLLSARVKFCQCQFWNNKSIPLQILSKFCVSLHFHERYVLYTFLAQTMYTLLKRSPLKWKFLRISSSAQVKIYQIFYVNFETTSWLLPKFCIPLQFHERLFLCTFFISNIIYFAQKQPIIMKMFETFKCSGQISSNSLCQFWNNKSIPLQILYLSSVSWKIIPLYFFSSKNIYFSQKKPNKMKIFEALKCSGQILSNSLCQFWNDKSIHLQILYPPSVSWKITPLYCF